MGDDALTQERKAGYFKQYYRDNFEKISLRKQRYSIENKERLNQQTRQWHKDNPEKSLLTTAKSRAKRLRLPFNLTIENIVIPSECPVLGIPLLTKAGKRTDNTPSLDRIIPDKGYVKGNIKIISWRANRLKCDASLAELIRLVGYMENNTCD